MRPSLAAAEPEGDEEWVSLAGQWRFALDPDDAGIGEEWFGRPLDDTIRLPGTADENRKGTRNQAWEPTFLTRVFPYVGAAWYQQEFTVPADWRHKRVALLLERTKASRLWLDGKALGGRDSLVAPHVYPLGELTPGAHVLTLRINNADHAPIGDPHQITEHTQTNWNGIVGRFGLRITDPVWVEDVQVYPDRTARTVRVVAEVGNDTRAEVRGTLSLAVGEEGQPMEAPFSTSEASVRVEAQCPLGADVPDWDEFSPRRLRLRVTLDASARGRKCTGASEVAFGVRDFRGQGTQFQVNGRTTFLRGKADCCVFPLTGYAPMDVDGWQRVFETAKAYGLNHYRFHSWCPPEAAFEAADRAGIYLQPELPNWRAFGDPAHDLFLRQEGERMLRAYGNHPSFVMLSLGNELGGSQSLMATFIDYFRKLDGRHLYAQGSNNWFPAPHPGDDYWTSFQVRGRHIRGSFATVDPPLGHVQIGPPCTTKDYVEEIAGMRVPVISHEVGQYEVAPDFREIDKYTGVLRARNLEIFRRRVQMAGMLDQSDDFHRVTGSLAVLCYREDIEAALRTPGFGGFQLLDLQDFPGQGTALVGILDSFLDSKGLVEPEDWRRFCGPVVLLARFPKYTWTVAETLTATVQVANYGPADLPPARANWALRVPGDRVLVTGRWDPKPVPQGKLTTLGEIRLPLRVVTAPAALSLDLSIEGTELRSSYPLWAYPDEVDTGAGPVQVLRSLDERGWQLLLEGASVLLLPEPLSLRSGIDGAFAPDFWNFGMFRGFAEQRRMPVAPGTLGLLCDAGHPALAEFPTGDAANWQWFHLLMNSRAAVLDDLPAAYRPIAQPVDNYERAHKLGTLFELRVGKGKLLVCTIDLVTLAGHPEARQLRRSLLRYMNSPDFAPSTEVKPDVLQKILA